MFFGGQKPTWNNDCVRAILKVHAAEATHVAWIDVHTGLGPFGHGEKIYAGPRTDEELSRARSWFGADVVAPFQKQSASPGATGSMLSSLYRSYPKVVTGLIGLEFGTLDQRQVQTRLRASQWMLRNRDCVTPTQRDTIVSSIRDAFYCDNDVWRGMVLGQTRTMLLQALLGLKNA
jgi:hypothetical protein